MGKYMKGHIGEEIITKQGYKCVVIDGGDKKGCVHIVIYNDICDYYTEISYESIKNKTAKTPYHRATKGVGYIGEGEYSTTKEDSNKNNLAHHKWSGMITRCYDPYYLNQNKNTNYRDVLVSDDWHCFQNFAEWFYDNYYGVDGCQMELDKDLIGDGKLYSKDNCCFIPHRLNVFLNKNRISNSDKSFGTAYDNQHGKWRAPINSVITNKRIYNGIYDNKEDAHNAYLKARELQVENIKNICIEEWGITDKRIIDNIE